VSAFRSIGGKPFLTRRCSGLTHKAASTAELIRYTTKENAHVDRAA
jgi:hypothetical protein